MMVGGIFLPEDASCNKFNICFKLRVNIFLNLKLSQVKNKNCFRLDFQKYLEIVYGQVVVHPQAKFGIFLTVN